MCGADSDKTAGDVGIVAVGSVLEPGRGTEERISHVLNIQGTWYEYLKLINLKLSLVAKKASKS